METACWPYTKGNTIKWINLFVLFRPTPEEAAQWRESLDKVLSNSCKYDVYHVYMAIRLHFTS